MRHIPEVITWGTGFVAAFWVSLYFSSNKTLGIWSLFGAVIFGALTCFLLWQNEIWKTQQTAKTPEAQSQQTEAKSNDIHELPPQIESRNMNKPSKENDRITFPKLSTAIQSISPPPEKAPVPTEPTRKTISRGGFIKATNVKGLTIENNTYVGHGDFADLDNVTDVKASGNKHIVPSETKK